jgi:hypothetical protein
MPCYGSCHHGYSQPPTLEGKKLAMRAVFGDEQQITKVHGLGW